MSRLPKQTRALLPKGTLAAARTRDGRWVAGTREALHIVGVATLPWEEIESAAWDRDHDVLRVSEVGRFGVVRPVHTFTLDEPGALLTFVRERVTASVVLQRRGDGFTVVARRSPVGGPITWACEYDEGVDPANPDVASAADEAVRAARDEVGAI